jgi:histidinol-phosphate aminotransferase
MLSLSPAGEVQKNVNGQDCPMLKPRKSIQDLHPYHSPIVSRAGLALDLNENAIGCSPRVLARLQSSSTEEVARYPKREAGEQLVANFLGIEPEQVLLTNGMDDALAQLFAAYLDVGDELLFADPTFVMYPMLGAASGAKVVRLQSGDDLTLPVVDFLKRITPRTRLIAIANPNNPTGLVAPRTDLLRIVEAAPHAAVLIDEAYYEFCGQTLIGDLPSHPNLFVARTFSKAYGLAGLRLGVLTGAPEQIEYIRRLCPPFNVNSVVLACLEEALADQSFVQDSVTQARNGCRQIEKLCAELNLHFWPSSANFVLVRLEQKAIPEGSQRPLAAVFVAAMHRRGIEVRDASSNPGCEGCVRITAGTSEQMPKVLQAIREAAAEAKAGVRQ